MTTYYPIEDNVKFIGEFDGDNVFHPIYQCQKCGHVISRKFARSTGVCRWCHDGYNDFEGYLDRVYATTIYVGEFYNHSISTALDGEVKKGKRAEEMAGFLQWGIDNLDELDQYDLLVPPPRGQEDASVNHMKTIGQKVSKDVGIPIQDVLYKKGDYDSQRSMESHQERRENVEDKVGCQSDFESSQSVIVIDDVASTCSTLKNAAKALVEAGAGEVVGLVIARSEKIDALVDAKVYIPEDEAD